MSEILVPNVQSHASDVGVWECVCGACCRCVAAAVTCRDFHSSAAMLGRHELAQTSLNQLHFSGKYASDRFMRGISKLRGLTSLQLPIFKTGAGELLSEVAQLTDLEDLDMIQSWVSETCLPLSTALSTTYTEQLGYTGLPLGCILAA